MNLSFPVPLGWIWNDLIQRWRAYMCACMCLTETQTQTHDIIFNSPFKRIHTKQLFSFHEHSSKDMGDTTHTETNGPFYKHGLSIIGAWTGNYIHYGEWGESIYPFTDVNGCTDEVWELISNCIPHYTVYAMTYSCWGPSYSLKLKGVKD